MSKEFSREAFKLALRCIDGGISDAQFRYIIVTKNLDPNEIVSAVESIVRIKTRRIIYRWVLVSVIIAMISSILWLI